MLKLYRPAVYYGPVEEDDALSPSLRRWIANCRLMHRHQQISRQCRLDHLYKIHGRIELSQKFRDWCLVCRVRRLVRYKRIRQYFRYMRLRTVCRPAFERLWLRCSLANALRKWRIQVLYDICHDRAIFHTKRRYWNVLRSEYHRRPRLQRGINKFVCS